MKTPTLKDGEICPHGLRDGVNCLTCDTDGAAEAQGYTSPNEPAAIDPGKLEVYAEEYSNFNREMPVNAEEVLRSGKVINHPAWDHFGKMYFEGGVFKEQVWQYGSIQEVCEADTVEGLFSLVNGKYGQR